MNIYETAKDLYVAYFIGTEDDDDIDRELCSADTLNGCKEKVEAILAHFGVKYELINGRTPKQTWREHTIGFDGKVWDYRVEEQWGGIDYDGDYYGFRGIRIMKKKQWTIEGVECRNLEFIQMALDEINEY